MSAKTGRAESKPRSRKHQTRKSIATRNSILEATLQCFIEIGYFRTTTTEIAKRANVTRGAVQYYFPTTEEVLQASVEYLLDQWLETYYEELRNMPETSNKFEHGVDTYWKFVRHPLFEAWRELNAAARTEPSLARIMRPAAARYDKARQQIGKEVYPEFERVSSERFDLGRDFARVTLEGLAQAQFTYDVEGRQEAIIAYLKKAIRDLWGEDIED